MKKLFYSEGLLYKDLQFKLDKYKKPKELENVIVDLDDPNFIMNQSDTIYYLNNDDIDIIKFDIIKVWDIIKKLDSEGIIHLGMRNATWYTVSKCDFFTLNTNEGKVWIILNGNRALFDNLEDIRPSKSYKYKAVDNNTRIIEYPILENYEVIDLKDFNQDIIDKLGSGLLGFDFETSNRKSENGFPLLGETEDEFVPLGFSLVSDNYGVFVDFRRYQDFKDPIWDFMHKFLKDNVSRLVAYNCQFEIQCLIHMFDEFFEIHDAMVMVNCDDFHSSPRGGWVNLKIASQKYNHAPSWDDELDDEMTLWKKIIHPDFKIKTNETRSKQELLNEIIRQRCIKSPEYSEEEIRKIYKDNLSVKYLSNNSWGLAFPPTLAKYCIFDGFYTLKIYETLIELFPNCVEVYHNNMWLGVNIHSNPSLVPYDELKNFKKRNRYLHKFAKMTVLARYYQFLKSNLKPYLDQLKVDNFTQRVLEYASEFITETPDKLLKCLVKRCVAEGDTTYKVIKDIYGSEIYLDFMNEFQGINPETKLRARKIWSELTDGVKDTSGVIKQWNILQLNPMKSIISEYNKNIDAKLSELGVDNEAFIVLQKVLIGSDFYTASRDYGIDKKQYTRVEEYLNSLGLDTKELFQADLNIFDDTWNEIFSLMPVNRLYINPKDYAVECAKATLWEMTNGKFRYLQNELSIATDIINCLPIPLLYNYYKSGGQPIFNFKSLVDYYKLKIHESELEDWVKTKTISEDDNDWIQSDDNGWWNKFYSASEDQKFDIMYNAMFYYKRTYNTARDFFLYTHRDMKLAQAESTPKEIYEKLLSKYSDTPDNIINSELISHFNRLPIEGVHNMLFRPNQKTIVASACMSHFSKKFNEYYGDDYVPSGSSKIVYQWDREGLENKFKDYARFFMLYKLESVAEKQMNPYITRYSEDSFKPVRLGKSGIILDKTQHGDRYVSSYEVNTKTTKRFSSFFHTIPGPSEERGMTIAEEGNIISYFDVSQAEPRVVAFKSGDENFIKDYRDGVDVYMKLARVCMQGKEIPEKELKEIYRGQFKSLLLGLHYGMSRKTLAKKLGLTLAEAERYIDVYFTTYPKVKPFIENAVEYAKKTGYAQTIYGDRIAVFPGAESRQGINYKIQNGASVSMVSGFYEALKAIKSYGIPIRIIGNIHDSLQESFPCKYYPQVKLINQKFFREKGYHDLGIDYKYDFELCRSLSAYLHFEPEFNYDTGEMEITGPENDIKYFIDNMGSAYPIVDYSQEIVTPKNDDVLKSFYTDAFCNWGWVMRHKICGDCDAPHLKPQNITKFKVKFDYDFNNDPIIKEVRKIEWT